MSYFNVQVHYQQILPIQRVIKLQLKDQLLLEVLQLVVSGGYGEHVL